MKKISKGKWIYTLFINLFICLSLSIASNLKNNGYIDIENVLVNLAFAYPIAICIGLFVPFLQIGKWFTGLFGIKHETYIGNLPYRLLAGFIAAVIYFILLNPLVTVFNVMVLAGQSFAICFDSWIKGIPLMFGVGYASTLVFDFLAYQIAHKIDSEF